MSDLRQRQFMAFVRTMVEDAIGMHYAEADDDLFEDKVVTHARSAGFESLIDYYYRLRYDDPDGEALAALVDTVTVNESYLFREQDQLQCIVREFLLPAVERQGHARVWSAACASGEEPFSVAMMLADLGALSSVEILASDVSQRCLARARRGALSPRALRDIARSSLADRYVDARGDELSISPAIVDAVRFERINLRDAVSVASLGTFDVILLKNVLIYFRDEIALSVVTSIADRLRPRGALFVGVSESLLRLPTGLECEEKNGVFFYRKPEK